MYQKSPQATNITIAHLAYFLAFRHFSKCLALTTAFLKWQSTFTPASVWHILCSPITPRTHVEMRQPIRTKAEFLVLLPLLLILIRFLAFIAVNNESVCQIKELNTELLISKQNAPFLELMKR